MTTTTQSYNQPGLASVIPSLWQKPVPVILQSEASECGLACLAMISGFHGFATDLTELRAHYAVSTHGATLRNIIDTASKLNLSARAVKLDMSQLSELQTPCILHWGMNHFVVLCQIKNGIATIHDPAIGRRKLSVAQVAEKFTGIATEFTPSQTFEKRKKQRSLSIKNFFHAATGLKRHLIVLFGLSLVLQVFGIASPYYLQLVVDDIIVRSDADALLVIALGFALLLLIELVVHTFRQLLMLALGSKLSMQMSTNLFQHLIHLPFSYFFKRHLGDVVSRFGSIVPVRDMLTQGLIAALLDGLLALITLAVMFLYDTKLALISLAIVLSYLLIKWLTYGPLRAINTEKLAAAAKENSHFMESVRAIKTIKLFGHEQQRQNTWRHHLVDVINLDIRLSRWQIILTCFNKLLFGVEHLLVIYFAAIAVMDNALTVGMLYAFISYKNRFTQAADGLINSAVEYRLLDVHFDRLADMVFTQAEQTPASTVHSSVATEGSASNNQSLVVDNLSFAYSSNSPDVFKQISTEFKSGETIAIIGRSGSGKSTLLHCLMGLLHSTEGSVVWQGQSIQHHPTYRSHIAAVMQDDQCLSGSLFDNITGFDPQPDQRKVVWATKAACLYDDITAMPMQFQTLVGDMGASLSGGQKQRLLIARALYRQPMILFMDEATSHLDTSTEAKVNANLKQLNCIRIIVAHRPQTIASADRVLKLEAGKLIPTPINNRHHGDTGE